MQCLSAVALQYLYLPTSLLPIYFIRVFHHAQMPFAPPSQESAMSEIEREKGNRRRRIRKTYIRQLKSTLEKDSGVRWHVLDIAPLGCVVVVAVWSWRVH